MFVAVTERIVTERIVTERIQRIQRG